MRKQWIPGALFPIIMRLGTRLLTVGVPVGGALMEELTAAKLLVKRSFCCGQGSCSLL